jgi:phosphodiesterase/alkaline phosphatase D-like protein
MPPARVSAALSVVLACVCAALLSVADPASSAPGSIVPRGPATSTTYGSDSTTSLGLGVPAGTQPGDLLVASLGFGKSGSTSQPTLTPPAGWTLVSRTNQGTEGTLAVYRHVFAAGETTYAWTTNVSVGGSVFLAAFGGVDTSNPIDVSAGQVTTKRGTAISTPSVTTSAANAMLVAGYFSYVSNGKSTSWAPPAGMTEIGDASNGGSRAGSLDYGAQATAGASGTKTATASTAQDYAVAVLTALRAAGSSSTNPPVISAVNSGSVTTSGATVSWTTDQPSDTQVEYGPSVLYGSSTSLNTSMSTSHSQALAGLTPNTTYHYRVKSKNAAGQLTTSGDYAFTTAAAADTTPPVISAVAAGSVTSGGATITWTTDEAADSQVEYGATSGYGSTTTLDSARTASHTQALSVLAPGTLYHYRVKSRDASGNLATSPDLTFQTSPGGPVPLTIDTDIFSDADDVGALATAFGLQIKGEANVIAIGVNTRLSRPAVTTNSWKCAAATAQFYNSGSVPIGTDVPNNGTETNTADFAGPCSRLVSPSTPSPDTAVNVYRRALAGQADGSVVMVGVGYFENLSALLDSPPDSISPLNGRDLVARKVKTLVVMGGGYPSRNVETNLVGNPAAAQNVANNWPTKLVWSGVEVGDAVHTGNTISSRHPASSPVRVSYEAFVGPNNWIYSYDLTAVYHAIRPADSLLTEVGPGKNVVNSSGGNTFVSGSGNQYYLSLGNATSLNTAIETLLDTLPATPPSDTTAPVISAVGASAVTSAGATIGWTTNEASDTQVEYGTTTAYGSTTSLDGSMAVSHSQPLSSLAPGTLYHYRVKSRDASGNSATSPDATFATASWTSAGPADTFDGNTIDPAQWVVTSDGSTVAAANQQLEFTHFAGGWTKGSIQSATPHDQTGKALQVQMKRAANGGLGGSVYGETSVFLWVDSTHYVTFWAAGGSLTAWVNNGGGEVNLTPSWPGYNAVNMQWLRFRESAGRLYFEYAGGATSPGPWSVLASTPDPFALTALTFKIVAGTNALATDTAQFDNVSTY